MRVWDQFRYAGTAVKTRKSRAALTTLGITIGIAAIVALLSLANGFQFAINEQFEKGFSTNTLTVTSRGSGGFSLDGSSGTTSNYKLTMSDVDAIAALSPHINLVVPIAQKTCNHTANGVNRTVTVVAVDFAKYNALYNTTFIGNESMNSVIPTDPTNTSFVIGARIAQLEDGTVNYKIGDNLNVSWYNSAITGLPPVQTFVLGNSSQSSVAAILPLIGGFSLGGPSDNAVYMQIGLALPFFNTTTINSIVVRLDTSDQAVIDSVAKIIQDYYNNYVSVTSGTAILNTINQVFGIITVFISAIAGISLVVAGIGIMNIQIVAILERTREIGILKAMGAKDRTVLSVFLVETIFIGLLGSVLGIMFGWIIALFAGGIMGGMISGGGGFGGIGGGGARTAASSSGLSISPILTVPLVAEALFFGLIVAVVFGLYPALRASRLKPVEALRYE